MTVRMYRGLSGRTVGSGEQQVLQVWPIYTGESLSHIDINIDIKSSADDTGTVDTGGQTDVRAVAEYDMYCLSIPYALAVTYLWDASPTGTPGAAGGATQITTSSPNFPTSVAQWDARFRDLLFKHDTEGNEYFGGDPSSPEQDSTTQAPDSQADDPGVETDIYRGPIGVVRHLGIETMIDGFILANANDARLGDSWSQKIMINRMGPAFVMLGVRRSELLVEATPKLAVNPSTTNDWAALNRLFGGDVHRNSVLLSRGGDALADKMRSLLFEGDQFVYTDTFFSDRDLHFRAKWMAAYSTPYSELARA